VRKFVAVVGMALLISGCATTSTASSTSIQQGSVTAVTIDSNPNFSVSRVVSLANGVAEIMNSLNAHSILVGRDISSTEAALDSIPVVTSGHQVIAEKVIALKPDLVIVDASTGPKSAIDQIKAAGIKVVRTPESWTLADIPTKVRAVGVAIGALPQAELLIAAMQSELKSKKISHKVKVAFLYLRGTSSIYLIGGPGSGADSLINAVGGMDVGAQTLPHPFNTLTAESLAAMNPDVILVMSKGLQSVGGIDGLLKLPGVAQTQAGKNKAVVDVDDSLLLSFGPRTPSLVKALARAIEGVSK
jgi:iron complex transport system substrate-binding protein